MHRVLSPGEQHVRRRTQCWLQPWYRRQLCTGAVHGGLVQAGSQLSMSLSSNLEKCAALQLMGLACLSGFVATLAEKEEIQRGEQVLSYSICILWFWGFSTENIPLKFPQWLSQNGSKRYLIHSTKKKKPVLCSPLHHYQFPVAPKQHLPPPTVACPWPHHPRASPFLLPVQRSNSLASIPSMHSDFGLGYTKGKKQVLYSKTEVNRDVKPNSWCSTHIMFNCPFPKQPCPRWYSD